MKKTLLVMAAAALGVASLSAGALERTAERGVPSQFGYKEVPVAAALNAGLGLKHMGDAVVYTDGENLIFVPKADIRKAVVDSVE